MKVPEYRKEHQNLLNQLSISGQPFIVYRMPGEDTAYIFIPTHIDTITSLEQMSEREGFVFAPFLPTEPAILFTEPIPPESFRAYVQIRPEGEIFPSETQRPMYLNLVNKAIAFMQEGNAKKVVVSGVFRQAWGGCNRSSIFFENLCNLYPEAYCYLARVPGYGLWAGASPETLIHWENGWLQTMALAGTLPVNSHHEWGLKEAQEHNWVVTFIEEMLKREMDRLPEITGPQELRAGSARHLCTRFRIECSARQALQTAFALHPTPAVCGIPVREALQFISENEKHPRELYTGFAGLISNQRLHLFVNLRCAKLGSAEAFIFAGGGITPDSKAEDEWDEITLKSGTLSAALLSTLAPTQTHRS